MLPLKYRPAATGVLAWRSDSRRAAGAGVAFAAQFFVCRILIGGYYGVVLLRAVLSLQPPQVNLATLLMRSCGLLPVC